MTLERIDQHHQIVSVSRIFDIGVLTIPCGFLRPLQHLVHLTEVEITEERRDHTTLWNTAFAGCFEHQLEQVQHLGIAHPLRYLAEQQIVPHVVKIGTQINVNDARLLTHNALGDPPDRIMGSPLRTITERSRLEVRLEDRLQYQLERTLDHPIPDSRYRQHANLSPILGYLALPRFERHIGTLDQFVPYLLEKALDALCLDGLERHAVNARRTVIGFRQRIGSSQCFHLADVNVDPPETP